MPNPGFECPVCSNLIQVTIRQLLYDKEIKCPKCLTGLQMDRANESNPLSIKLTAENLDQVNFNQFKLTQVDK